MRFGEENISTSMSILLNNKLGEIEKILALIGGLSF